MNYRTCIELIVFQDDTEIKRYLSCDQKLISIGRNIQNDLYIPDFSKGISRVHCLLIRENETDLYLQDVSSHLATRVNGKAMSFSKILAGDVLELGDFQIQVQIKNQTDQKPLKPVKTKNASFDQATLVTQLFGENPEEGLEVLRQYPEELAFLYRLSSLLHQREALEEILFAVSKILMEHFPVQRVVVAKRMAKDETFFEIINYPYRKKTISSSLLALLEEKKEILAIPDVKKQARLKDADSIIYSDIHHVLISPLFDGGRVIGFFYLEGNNFPLLSSPPFMCLIRFFSRDLSSLLLKREELEYLNDENLDLKIQMEERDLLIGISEKNKQAQRFAKKFAEHDATVLITGETGTGKDVLARYIHNHSPRRNEKFIPVNCAALPEAVLESELFGVVANYPGFHNKEALPGKFLLANKGSLFLNEIGELPLALQAKLLSAIENREIWPLGSPNSLEVDMKIIAATNKDLRQEVKNGRFRADLFERLHLLAVEMPALREKKEDIPVLAGYFLHLFRAKYNKNVIRFSKSFLKTLHEYDWPRNIRELKNSIERAVVLAESGSLLPGLLDLPGETAKPLSLNEVEREHIIRVLRTCKGNKENTAKLLGIAKQTLYNKLNEYHISTED